MSPIAPRRSSFEVVSSSWITTSRSRAQSRKSAAKRSFVTRWISSTSGTSEILSSVQSTIGRPPTGSSGFARFSVSGRSRVAYPAARISAFIEGTVPPTPRRDSPSRPAQGLSLAIALGPLVPRGQVLRLLLGQLVDLDAHRLELQARDLLVDLLGHDVHLPLEAARILDRVLGGEGLVRERHVH